MHALLAALFLLVPALAQTASGGTETLASGESLYDTSGRHVTNGGNNNGSVTVKYDGKLKVDVHGKKYIDGNIEEVVNPSNGGSDGLIEVTTNNQPITIKLYRSGRNNPLRTRVDGGNAKVLVNGNENEVTVSGTGNDVSIDGRNCNCSGTANSGGDVRLSHSSSTFNSGGGNWTFRR